MRRRGARQQRSDDEARPSLVPDRRERKTRRIEWMCLLLAVLKLTKDSVFISTHCLFELQQYLPLVVLKHSAFLWLRQAFNFVATVLIVFGIETNCFLSWFHNQKVVTVPTTCGMRRRVPAEKRSDDEVRTSLVPDWKEGKTKKIERVNVLIACGIETGYGIQHHLLHRCNSTYRLRYWNNPGCWTSAKNIAVTTALTACGIETSLQLLLDGMKYLVAIVLTACGIETVELG